MCKYEHKSMDLSVFKCTVLSVCGVYLCMSAYCLCERGCEYVCVWARVYVHEHALGFVCVWECVARYANVLSV